MFYAMNRFEVPLDQAPAFERRWLERDSRLHEFDGFVEFNLLKGPEANELRIYISHTIWRSEADFQVWLKSPRFKEAHKRPQEERSADNPAMVARSQFEMLTSIQRVLPEVQA